MPSEDAKPRWVCQSWGGETPFPPLTATLSVFEQGDLAVGVLHLLSRRKAKQRIRGEFEVTFECTKEGKMKEATGNCSMGDRYF